MTPKPESEGDHSCIKSSQYHRSLWCLLVLVQSTFFVCPLLFQAALPTQEPLQIDARSKGGRVLVLSKALHYVD